MKNWSVFKPAWKILHKCDAIKGELRKAEEENKTKSSARRKSCDATTVASCSIKAGDWNAKLCLLKLVLDVYTFYTYLTTYQRCLESNRCHQRRHRRRLWLTTAECKQFISPWYFVVKLVRRLNTEHLVECVLPRLNLKARPMEPYFAASRTCAILTITVT